MSDSLALVAFYNATGGPNWTNTWDLTEPIDEWYGVELNEDGCVTCLVFSDFWTSGDCYGVFGSDWGNNLIGDVPPEIGNLSQLQSLILPHNSLTSIPTEIGNLINLEILSLKRNQLTSIPPEISNLDNLEILSLWGNQLSFKDIIENINEINITVQQNSATGSYFYDRQDSVGIEQIITLTVGDDYLLDLMVDDDVTTNVYEWQKDGNIYATTLVNEISFTNIQSSDAGTYTVLFINPVAPDLTLYSRLVTLVVENAINPCQAQDYIALRALYFSTDGDNWTDNTGWLTAAEFLANPTMPAGTDVSTWYGISVNTDGCVTCIDMDGVDNCGYVIPSGGNNLVGTLPLEIGNLNNLEELYLGSNAFTSLPAEIGNLANLETLILNSNALTGLPEEISNLANLGWLHLASNQLTSISAEVGNLGNLEWLYLQDNNLTSLPVEIGNLNNLVRLSLNGNALTSLPIEIGNLNNLQYIHWNDNQLTFEDIIGNFDEINTTVQQNGPWLGSHIYNYAPQDSIGTAATITLTEGDSYTLDLMVDDTVTTSTYQWHKDGSPYTTTTLNELSFTSLQVSDAGTYTCEVTNPIAPDLTLYSRPVTLVVENAVNPCQAQDYTALRALYLSTDGDNWTDNTGWLTAAEFLANPTMPAGTDVSTWYGISVNTDGCVTCIDLDGVDNCSTFEPPFTGNNLIGVLPSEIGGLTNLDTLSLGYNNITNIPFEIGNLVNLQLLNLTRNQLTTLPLEIGDLNNLRSLAMGGNNLISIPSTIGNLNNLQRLNLQLNQLSNLPLEIGNLGNLRALYLNDNQLTIIPEEIFNLVNLKLLQLDDNQLTNISLGIENLVNLQTLILSDNLLTNIPTEIKNLGSLQWLSLHINNLTFEDIISEISVIEGTIEQNATESAHSYRYAPQDSIGTEETIPRTAGDSYTMDLTVDDTVITNTYQWYKNGTPYTATAVNELSFASLQVSDAGTYTCEVTNPIAPDLTLYSRPVTLVVENAINPCQAQDYIALRALYLSTDGDNWTDNTGWLTEAEFLANPTMPAGTDVSTWYGISTNADGCVTCIDLDGVDNCSYTIDDGNNLVGGLPAEIGNLINLERLSLSYNQLTGLPPEIVNLSNLERLNLNDNNLTSIPPEIGNLNNLERLLLYRNELTSLPSEIGNLSNLKYLSAFSNQLVSLPPEIGNLNSLEVLFLSSNNLTSIPSEIGNLGNLIHLDLYGNQLTSLPAQIGNLNNLKYLYLSNNQITSLPIEIGNLNSLKTLSLSDNRLMSVTSEIGNLNNLEFLSVAHNQLVSLPYEITNLDSLEVLSLESNRLMSLPNDISDLDSLHRLWVEDNQLTFGYIIGNFDEINTTIQQNATTTLHTYTYAPQDSIGTEETIPRTAGDSYTIDLIVDDTVITSTYQWYKDGTPYTATAVNELSFASLQVSDAGTYTCEVTNPIAPDLTLYSRPVTLVVAAGCDMEITCIDLTPETDEALMDGSAQVDITGGIAPYEIIWNGAASDTLTGIQGNTTISSLSGGAYNVTITDAIGCQEVCIFSILYTGPCESTATIVIHGPTSFCESESATLTASSGFSSYAWSNGATTQSVTVSTPATYAVTVNDATGCTATDDFDLNTHDFSNLTINSDTVCAGEPIILTLKDFPAPVFEDINIYPNKSDTDITTGRALHANDIDGDGDIDILSPSAASFEGIILYENIGDDEFKFNFLSFDWFSGSGGSHSIHSTDIDEDGDIDIFATGSASLTWLENDGAEHFTPHYLDYNLGYNNDVKSSDFDQDGDEDLILAVGGENRLTIFLNDGDESFTQKHIINGEYDVQEIYLDDIDSDGDIDIACASNDDDSVYWMENQGSNNFTYHLVASNAYGAHGVFIKDVDSDGDKDILSASSDNAADKIAWYENNGNENFVERIVSTNAESAFSVFAEDVDSDGDIDILSASYWDDKIAWYENNGNQNFSEHIITNQADAATLVIAVDVDGNNSIDIISASSRDSKIAWYKNDGNESFVEKIVSTSAHASENISMADIDNDGDNDFVGISHAVAAWYENKGSNNFERHNLATNIPEIATSPPEKCSGAIDLDFDGDTDIILGFTNRLSWLQNDGNQNFSENIIINNSQRVEYLQIGDFNNDGDWDIVCAYVNENKISLLENLGNQNFTEKIVSTNVNGVEYLEVVDFDNDGDLDITAAAIDGDKISWFENNGANSFSENIITNNLSEPEISIPVDIDLDGDYDIVSFNKDEIVWYDNDATNNNFNENIISVTGTRYLRAGDIDGDGDIDLISTSNDNNRYDWFENDGKQNFQRHIIEYTSVGAYSVQPAHLLLEDYDNDGDKDLISTMYSKGRIVIYNNEKSLVSPLTLTYTLNGGSSQQISGVDIEADSAIVNIPDLASGVHTLNITNITDATGCSSSVNITTTVVVGFELVCSELSSTSTAGDSDGQANINISGISTPYTISWSGEDVGTQQGNNGDNTISDLQEGEYVFTVTDARGCEETCTVEITGPPCAVTATLTETQSISCYATCEAAVELTTTNATTPLTYTWSDAALEALDAQENLCAGSYQVTITDANGCEATASIDLTEPEELSSTISPVNATCGEDNGEVSVTVTGGIASYTYLWDDADEQTTDTIRNLAADTYLVEITDANGCMTINSVTIQEESIPQISGMTIFPATCGNNNGTLAVQFSGGVIPFEFSINGGNTFQSNNTFINLATDTYDVVLRDANGCIDQSQVEISSEPLPSIDNYTVSPSTCGSANGAINLVVSGGVAPFAFDWDIDSTGDTDDEQNPSNLLAGTYHVTLTDDYGCTSTQEVMIEDIPAPVIDNVTATEATCISSGAEITITTSGGTSPLQYSINSGTNFTSENAFTGVPVGAYDVVVQDANNCTATSSVTVVGEVMPSIGNIISNNPTCGSNNGSLNITAQGGNSPYEYSIDNGVSFQNENVFEDLAPGMYEVLIRDASSCTGSQSTELIDLAAPEFDMIEALSPTCGEANGVISIALDGGNAPFQYSINNGVSFQSNSVFNGLIGGDYMVLVNDVEGCQITDNITLDVSEALSVDVTTAQPGCQLSDGSIQVTCSGGNAPYEYIWSTGGTSNQLAGINDGNYTITITDTDGCEITKNIDLMDSGVLNISLGTDSESCLPPNVYLTTGIPNSIWSDGVVRQGRQITDFGTYIVTVAANGCARTDTIQFAQKAYEVMIYPTTDTAIFEGNIIDFDILNAVEVEWFPSTGLDCTDCLNPRSSPQDDISYAVYAENNEGCRDTTFVNIDVRTGLDDIVEVPTTITLDGDGINEVLIIENIDQFPNNRFLLMNRYGDEIYSAGPYTNSDPWDGTHRGGKVPKGVYYYILDLEITEYETRKGSIVVF